MFVTRLRGVTEQELTPHGRLLEDARGRMSKREAASRAEISEGRWRQIVTGLQKVGGGRSIPVNPKPGTLVAMAEAVGLDAAAVLAAAGFEPRGWSSEKLGRLIPDQRPTAPEDTPIGRASNELLAAELTFRLTGRRPATEDAPDEVQWLAARATGREPGTAATRRAQDDIETGSQDPGGVEPA